ncbi:EamA family transporter [Neosynechococcus sphagnicola]|uniref:EamA family transporter n=1 Tax=Neosynechococcus sphagnicola TaxID=1501145 RepID=UPI000690F551|nr:EamA family transporter [Neosynechococcus sphagnicola]
MKNILLLALLVVLQVLGYAGLSYGLHQVGAMSPSNPLAIFFFGLQVFSNLWVLLGVLSMIASLLLYLVAISRLDLSYVLPILASNYVLTTLVGWLILGEKVSAPRWIGTLLITAGVLMVGLSEHARNSKRSRKSIPHKT